MLLLFFSFSLRSRRPEHFVLALLSFSAPWTPLPAESVALRAMSVLLDLLAVDCQILVCLFTATTALS